MPWLKLEEYKKTRAIIKEILDHFDIQCLCGQPLLSKNIRSTESKCYETEESEYWIYCECSKCHYDYNYEKILRQYSYRAISKKAMNQFQKEMR